MAGLRIWQASSDGPFAIPRMAHLPPQGEARSQAVTRESLARGAPVFADFSDGAL